ncbi:Troponin C [Phytophthora citrophthora]|uniref:Troponin C n=1 Tax=Phytophthora citrophthora TaxID=4793 RepID=A0AAD9G3Y7_9STRA|nr:Troponin C [Phytophthora citrophthora]
MKGSMLKRTPGSGNRSTKKKKESTKLCLSPPKISFRDPIGHELPSSLQKFRWSADKVERKLQEKIQEKTLIAGNFVYQQAYRLLEGNRGEGIDFPSFREQLRVKFGIILDDNELQLLFDKYDEDGNGTIDLQEFIRRVLPPDYNYGRQWFEVSQLESEERAARLKHEARQEFLACQGLPTTENVNNTGTASNWTIEKLMKHIQAKVVQKTPSGEDQYRRAFKMLRTGRDQGIRMNGLQFNLKTKFGIYASDEQMRQLFSMCDQDCNGEIDLKEFLQFVDPPAYPSNSKVPRGIWTWSDSEDEDEDSELADMPATGRGPRLPTGPPSVQNTPRRGSSLSSVSTDEERPATAPTAPAPTATAPARVRKERPRTANPRKTHMLQQRREMVEQQRMKSAHARQQAYSVSMSDIHSVNLDALSLASGDEGNYARPLPRAMSARTARPRSTASVYSEAGTASVAGRGDRGYPPRPRSAGSVRSYASSSSAGSVGSVGSSVKGAAYMKRPPTPQMKRPATPQTLRQKCLESRGVSAAMASEAHAKTRNKRVPLNASEMHAEQQLLYSNHVPRDGGRRHSYSEIPSGSGAGNIGTCNCNCACASREVAQPRIVRVHAKQYNGRPYTAEGRVNYRSKVLSSGCL